MIHDRDFQNSESLVARHGRHIIWATDDSVTSHFGYRHLGDVGYVWVTCHERLSDTISVIGFRMHIAYTMT